MKATLEFELPREEREYEACRVAIRTRVLLGELLSDMRAGRRFGRVTVDAEALCGVLELILNNPESKVEFSEHYQKL
jgi:hypothetical protein